MLIHCCMFRSTLVLIYNTVVDLYASLLYFHGTNLIAAKNPYLRNNLTVMNACPITLPSLFKILDPPLQGVIYFLKSQ